MAEESATTAGSDAAGGRSLREHALALATMVLLAMPFALSSLILPWGRDQGIYAQAGARLLDGYLPYRDTFVFKPPVTVFVHSLAMALFGREMWAIRALDVGWSVATGVVLYAIAFKATGSRVAGAAAGIAFAWQMHRVGWWASAQTDGWSNLFVGLALLAVLAGRPTWWKGLLGGLAVGVVFWFKYTGGAILPVVVVLPLLRGWRRGWLATLGVVGGFAASIGLGFGLMALTGTLEPFLTIQREVVFPYTGAGGGKGGIAREGWNTFGARLHKYFQALLVPAGAGALAVVGRLVWRLRLDDRDAAGLAALGWALAGLAAAWAQGKFFQYQYLLWVGGACLLMVVAGSMLVRFSGRLRLPLLGAMGLVYVVTLAGDPFPERWESLSRIVTGGQTLAEDQHRRNYRTRDMSLRDNVAAGAWLESHTDPDDTVLVWAYDPMVYVLGDRNMAGRFPYTYPLVVPWAPVEAYEAELLEDLRRAPPAAILIGSRDAVKLVTGHKKDSRRMLRELPELDSWIRDRYVLAERVGRYEILVPREQP